MSTAEYLQDRADAELEIRLAGKRVWQVVRQRFGGTERDPIYGTTLYPLWAVELNQRLRNLDGSLAPATAHTLLVSTEGMTVPLSREHSIQFSDAPGSSRYAILAARPLRPGEVVIMWEIDLGGA